jgi:hypothetical protein
MSCPDLCAGAAQLGQLTFEAAGGKARPQDFDAMVHELLQAARVPQFPA